MTAFGTWARTLLLAALAFAANGRAEALDYPTRPVTIIVPYAPGGATDIVARVIADYLRGKLGQNFVVENKPGAFGILAIQEMVKAKADGYTMMVGNVSTNAITPILFPKRMQLDYEKSVVPVTELITLPAFFYASANDFPPTSLKDVIDYAKAHPGQVHFVSAGIGSFPQFDMVLFANRTGVDLVHIPAKDGAAGMMNAMLTGDAQISFMNVASGAGQIKAGRLRPLAVTTDARLPDYPDVPTMAELGFPGIGTTQWNSLFVKAGTPEDVTDLVRRLAIEALNSEQAKTAFAPQHISVATQSSTADARKFQDAEIQKWRKIVDETKISLE